MEEYQVECGDCGSSLSLEAYERHVCAASNLDLPTTPGTTQAQESSSEELVPRLIELVQARPPLWDHTLPLKMRGKDVRERLWKEIQVELGHYFSIPNMEKKWKNLKDTFLKNLKICKPLSGAGTDDKKKWKYFQNLEFLTTINMPKRTISNVESPLLSPVSSVSATIDSDVEATPSSSRRIKKNDETEKLLLNVLREPAPPQTTQPQLSPALLTIQSVLEKLPERVRIRAEIDMINKVYSLYEELEQ